MHRTSLLLCCCLLFGSACLAQNARRDSLRQALRHTSRQQLPYFELAARIAETYRFQQPDSADKYAQITLSGPEAKSLFRFKASAANTLGYSNYQRGRYQDAIQNFNRYYSYAAKDADKVSMAYAINNAGNVYIDLGDYNTALDKYREALALRQNIGDRKGVAMSYNNIGYIYKDLGDYDEAVRNMLMGLREMEALGDKNLIASGCNMLGAVYLRKKDYAQAIALQQRAIALQQEIGDKNGEAISQQLVASAKAEQGHFEEALKAYEKALAIFRASSDQRQICILEGDVATLYARQKKYAESAARYEKAIALCQKIGYRRSLALFWMGQASNQIFLGKLPEARILLDSAHTLIAHTASKEDLKTYYELQSRYFAAKGDFKEALDYSMRYAAQKDTLLNEENLKAMSNMSVRYESEKKQATIARLDKESALQQLELKNQSLRIAEDQLRLSKANLQITQSDLQIKTQNALILTQKLEAAERARHLDSLSRQARLQRLELANRTLALRQRNFLILGLAALLLLGALLSYSYYRRAKLKAASRMQQALMQQQEQATRAVLAAEEAERERIAKDLHDGVGQMMSVARMNLSAYEHRVGAQPPEQQQALERVIAMVDQSCAELRSVSHSMLPNALIKNSLAAAVRDFISQIDQRRLTVHLYTEGLDERLDSNIETVLYRIIQECVNNVVKHSGAHTLDISLVRDERQITVSIEDNGKGFDLAAAQRKEGIGLKNIQTRMDFLKGSVDIDTAPGRGTVVVLNVPLGGQTGRPVG